MLCVVSTRIQYDQRRLEYLGVSASTRHIHILQINVHCLKHCKLQSGLYSPSSPNMRQAVYSLGLHVGTDAVTPSNVVRDLGVLLDSELTMRQHISKIVGVCFYHLRRLKKVRRISGSSVTYRLVTAFVTSYLDYCNALLTGLPKTTTLSYP